MKYVCATNECVGCMACLSACSSNAISVIDELSKCNSQINESDCKKCGACVTVCQKNNPIDKYEPIEWYQGWTEKELRKQSTSGGIASAIMESFIDDGGFVCACRFTDGKFVYNLTNNKLELALFAGSKYVKSNPANAYSNVIKAIRNKQKVLFIGLPCHVAALKKLAGNTNCLYTIELICHGAPSPKLLEKFLREKGYSLQKISKILFRMKSDNTYTDYIKVGSKYALDEYSLAFLNGLIFTENCYYCDYATHKRTGD